MFHKRLMKEFKENQKYVAGMVATQWGSLLCNVALMYAIGVFLEKLLLYNRTVGEGDIAKLFIVFAAVYIGRAVFTSIGSHLSFAVSTQVKRKLRELVYEKLMKLGSSYHAHFATSEIVQISTEGVEQLEIYFGKYVPQFFYSLLAPLTLFLIVGSMSLKIAVVLLLCVPLIPVSIVAVQKFAKKLLAKYWGSYTELGDSFLENLQGLTTLKIYQADERYAKKMDEEAEQFRRVTMRVLIMQLNSISIMDLVAYGGAGIGIILSVLELRASHITLAECIFIILISAEFFLPLRLLGSFFHIAMNGNAAADKIFKLLDEPLPQCGKNTKIGGDDIVFSDVSFAYEPEKPVLKGISFTAEEGAFTALVGVSGCGKSTAASLMMGEGKEQDAFSGTITVGGVNIHEIAPDALYRKITRVRHDSYLFAGTVRENLCMGRADATTEEMEAALKAVDLYDTVSEKGGLSMEITEKASNLSGGQKQRLALAKALLHDSDIYIFDEATSNVDVESENKIMEVIRELAQKKTVILISHRLANVTDADQILVMKDGVIEESGVHAKLMEKNDYYSSLYKAQQELEKYAKEAV
jgi:ABC-type transport system involved in cytochrome bd biosynthesis fused ATPase/permease subunit